MFITGLTVMAAQAATLINGLGQDPWLAALGFGSFVGLVVILVFWARP